MWDSEGIIIFTPGRLARLRADVKSNLPILPKIQAGTAKKGKMKVLVLFSSGGLTTTTGRIVQLEGGCKIEFADVA